MKKVIVLALALLPCCLRAGIFPDYDSKCDAMSCHAALIDPISIPDQREYFCQRAPKIIHQIWFGDQSKRSNLCEQWREYAKTFNYEYHLWTEESDPVVQLFMNPQNFDLMVHYRKIGNYWSGSDILRYELLKHFGGFYIDCDFAPPKIDMEQVINFEGLTLMLEAHARNIGTTAVFVANGFIISPPRHPVILSLVDQVLNNSEGYYKKILNLEPCYMTGPFLMNKVLSGPFNVVSNKYLKSIGMANPHPD